jgi:hypothetical protein
MDGSDLRVGEWSANVPAAHREIFQVIAAAGLSLAAMLGMAFDGGPASAHPYLIWRIYAGFAGAILTCAYVVHLRARKAPFVLTPEAIVWRERQVPRAHASLRLLRWPHLLHDGTIIEIGDPEAPLRVGVSHRLVPSSILGPWRLHGHVDVILSPPDFSDVMAALGVARLGWGPVAELGPGATWFSTIGVVSLFGLGIGFSGIGDLMRRDPAVRVAVMTVMFGMIAVGAILTFTRGARTAASRSAYHPAAPSRAPDRRDHPARFWPAVGQVLGWQVASAVIAIALFVVPIGLTERAFARWVDIPACRADCAALNLPFRAYRGATKHSSGVCECGDRRFPRDYTVTGGTSFGAHLFNWFVRAASFVVALFAWPFAIAAAFIGWRKLRRPRSR